MTAPDFTQAACLGDGFLWFSLHPADIAAAVTICNGCPVRDACLERTLTLEGQASGSYRYGIAGGLTGAQRARLAKGLPPARGLAPCGTTSAYARHKANGQKACEPCLKAVREARRRSIRKLLAGKAIA